MSSKPSTNFSAAFAATVDTAALQLERHDSIRQRMSAGALAVIAAVALSMTVQPAHAQNQIKRTAADVLGGVIGGALGSKIGQGNGRKAAEVAGAAAGVWVSESLQDEGGLSNGRYQRSSSNNFDNFGPSGITPTVNSGGMRNRGSSMVVPRSSAVGTAALLQSGSVPLNADRIEKLNSMEQSFLTARDNYARSMYAVQQLQDDLVLSPSNRGLSQQVAAADAQKRAAEQEYSAARKPFTEALEYLGARGYDVHQYAGSYQLAHGRVAAGDMKYGDQSQAVHSRSGLHDVEQVRGDTYTMR